MSNFARHLRQTLTVARRDFVASVATPTFLIFLLAPLIMLGFGVIGGMGAATMADSGDTRMRLVVIAGAERAGTVTAIDRQLRELYAPRSDDRPPPLRVDTPGGNTAAQARALFDGRDVDVAAVLHGPLEAPQILYGPRERGAADYLAQLAEQAVRAERLGSTEPLSQPTLQLVSQRQVSVAGKSQVAFFGVFGLFFLTLLLAGQAVGTMAEERSNKVIEVLAAAVPLESVFLGKLVGTFGVALLFIGFWGAVIFNLSQLMPPEIARGLSDVGAAVGFPAYPLLFLAYFTMAFMLLSAVFLGIGAQASTPREIQMLSLPITIFQVAMFGFSSAAAANPGSWIALAAEIFPFSSPFAMMGRAASSPALWPHFLALAWQALWVGMTISIGARWFRRGVLQSGGPKFRFPGTARRAANASVDMSVS